MRALILLSLVLVVAVFTLSAEAAGRRASLEARLRVRKTNLVLLKTQQDTTGKANWDGPACVTAFKDNYKLGKRLGQGGQGEVYALKVNSVNKNLPNGWPAKLAIKAVDLNKENMNEVKVGLEITQNLNHAAWTKMYDAFSCVPAFDDLKGTGAGKQVTKLYIVMEFVSGKELNSLCLENRDTPIKTSLWRLATFNRILDDVSAAVDQGWNQINLLHNDLQGRNVLVDMANDGYTVNSVKIIDYGFSSTANHKKKRYPTCSKHYDMSLFAAVFTQCLSASHLAATVSADENGFNQLFTRLYNFIGLPTLLQKPEFKTDLKAVKPEKVYKDLKTAIRSANMKKADFAFPGVGKDDVNWLAVFANNDQRRLNPTPKPVVMDWVSKPDIRRPRDGTDACTQ